MSQKKNSRLISNFVELVSAPIFAILQSPSKLFCRCWQTDSKVYMEGHKTQNSQHNIEEGQSWRNDTIQLQDLLYSHSNKDSAALINQWNRMESPEGHPHKYSQLIFDKGAKATQWSKDSLFNKC